MPGEVHFFVGKNAKISLKELVSNLRSLQFMGKKSITFEKLIELITEDCIIE